MAGHEYEEDIDHNSFLQGIQVAENIVAHNTSLPNTAEKGQNLFDQSSLLLGQVIDDLDKPPSNQTNKAEFEKL
jgi:hypothetical protein